jgi:spore coat polysaccharide biosynthesis protein SpsF
MQHIIDGLVTVRTSSKRLPGKCLLPFGEGNVINHLIARAKAYNIDPIICTSTDKSDDVLEKIALNEGVRCFRGSLNNKLKRWSDCAEHFELKIFHTVDADDPFFDGEEMHRSMQLLKEGRYDIVYPTESSSSGGANVGYSLTADIVKKAIINLSNDTDTEMMWYYLEKIEGRKTATLAESREHPLKLRLTLDYVEDYWLLRTVQRLVGSVAARSEIDELFLRNPDLYKVNWFHNEEWKAAQIAKKI